MKAVCGKIMFIMWQVHTNDQFPKLVQACFGKLQLAKWSSVFTNFCAAAEVWQDSLDYLEGHCK